MRDFTHPLWGMALAGLLLTGCWMRAEKQMMERSETMEGHLLALFDAVSAVQDGDDKRFKDSMRDLEKGGEVPGVEVGSMLDVLHETAAEVRKKKTRAEKAEGLLTLASQCSGCHAAHDVQTPPLYLPETDTESAFGAIVWNDQARWDTSWKTLGQDPVEGGWAERRKALTVLLGKD